MVAATVAIGTVLAAEAAETTLAVLVEAKEFSLVWVKVSRIDNFVWGEIFVSWTRPCRKKTDKEGDDRCSRKYAALKGQFQIDKRRKTTFCHMFIPFCP